MFNSYVKLPEGNYTRRIPSSLVTTQLPYRSGAPCCAFLGGFSPCPKCHEESSPQGFVLPFSLWGQDMSLHVFQCVPFFLQHPWGQEIPIFPWELSIGSNSYHCDLGFGCWLISPYFHPCLMGPKPFKNTKTTWVIYRIDNRRCHLVGAETARIGWLIRLTTDMFVFLPLETRNLGRRMGR